MALIYITEDVGDRIKAGTIKNWPRSTIAKVSRTVGHDDWFRAHDPHAQQTAKPKKRKKKEAAAT